MKKKIKSINVVQAPVISHFLRYGVHFNRFLFLFLFFGYNQWNKIGLKYFHVKCIHETTLYTPIGPVLTSAKFTIKKKKKL